MNNVDKKIIALKDTLKAYCQRKWAIDPILMELLKDLEEEAAHQ